MRYPSQRSEHGANPKVPSLASAGWWQYAGAIASPRHIPTGTSVAAQLTWTLGLGKVSGVGPTAAMGGTPRTCGPGSLVRPRGSPVAERRDVYPGYLRRLSMNPKGLLLNTNRPANPAYVILHRATCPAIPGAPNRGDNWTKDLFKHCADQQGGADGPRPCRLRGRGPGLQHLPAVSTSPARPPTDPRSDRLAQMTGPRGWVNRVEWEGPWCQVI